MPVCDRCGFTAASPGSLGNHIKWEHADGDHKADDVTVAYVKKVAGDGTLDERCARILTAFREEWWGHPYPAVRKAEPEPDPAEERFDPQVWWEAS